MKDKARGSAFISRWFDGEYLAYIEDRKIYKRLIRRKNCRPHGLYWLPDGTVAWDIIVTADTIQHVRDILKKSSRKPRTKMQARTSKSATKRGLGDNKLQGSRSALNESKSD